MTIANNGLHFPASNKVHGGRVEIDFYAERGGYCAGVWVINDNFPEGFKASENVYIWCESSEQVVARATAWAIREEIIGLDSDWSPNLIPSTTLENGLIFLGVEKKSV